MNPNIFFSTRFSPLTNFITTIFFFLFANKASCTVVDPKFVACNIPKTCGDGQNISFPFYIQGEPQPFCGYPGFHLSCNKFGKPILKLSDNDYIVHKIFYQNQSILVSNSAMLLDKNTSCTNPPIQNLSLPADGRFHLFNSTSSLVLLYNCNSSQLANDSKLSTYKVDCADESTSQTGSTVAMLERNPLLDYASEKCKSRVVAPVADNIYGGEDQKVVGIQGMLERGFVLNWTASNCSICEESGGKCGFDETTYHFRCFCPDGPHSWGCNFPEGKKRLGLKLGLAASAAGIGIIMITLCYFQRKYLSNNFILCCKRKTRDNRNIETFLTNYGPLAPKRYTNSQVKKMTESFKDKLGQGGFGSVFKGKLPDGRLVAVKVLKESKSNGEEFFNEVASIGRTSHVNIVTLLGFCLEGSKRALIYEFMSNGSLEKHIYEDKLSEADRKLGWKTLYQIAVGVARGLEYLHRGCNTRILHFDIKPHNILLDENFCPKISDFELAKICTTKESIVSMAIARGTVGYIAPEVFCRNFGGVSHKSDVYSYGMMVLEVVGWRKNICVEGDNSSEKYFPHWIYENLEVGNELGVHEINSEEENQLARKMTIVSLWCIQTDPSSRPSMSRVAEMLQGDLQSLPIPPKPCLSLPPRSPQRSVEDSSSTTTDRL